MVYWLQVFDSKGYMGKDSLNVSPKQWMEGFYIPNAFTPNNDDKNDVFRPMLYGKVRPSGKW